MLPRSWSDIFYVPMKHDSYLSCLNAPIDFPPFYNHLVSHKRHICAHALAEPYPGDSYKASLVFYTRITHAGH
ncbi:unnamed protein product [Hymenolepis diminuta]|uniref:Uncharacterized protein n=1 Tax=Hymenolepis diminuta TaxID=6216 RepID=A0A564ZCF2_HYMDI|nr:unnamed protein product [Hymenolepis diminuta]